MSTIELIGYGVMYTLAWFVIGCGFTFILASAFFGYPEEKDEENQDVV